MHDPDTASRRRHSVAGMPDEGRRRVVIEGTWPEIDGGRFPVKRTPAEQVVVEADIFADGHDALGAVVRYRHESDDRWCETRMTFVENDRWRASFTVAELGCYRYTVTAWIDRFASWRKDIAKKIDAGQDVSVDRLAGATLAAEAAKRAPDEDAARLRSWAEELERDDGAALRATLDEELSTLMARYDDRAFATDYPRELEVVVDPPKARFSTWYELFPRSASPDAGRHGTLRDVIARLPYVAGMGFDVLYLAPIHPIGRTNRKGPNNAEIGGPDAPGSPWAIGSEEGGHTAIHPELGTFADFDDLVAAAHDQGVEIAMDVAFQCSPDHPWVREHPEWFRKRPDGTIQYAENPPKKYQDIFPIDFETPAWRELWEELRGVFEFWIARGVRIFRVDNPHTKALRFWEWLIRGIKRERPDVIFLSEAFTRPKLMYRLAKAGFTQSYTYFAWRNTKWELTDYFTELTTTEVAEYFRPNLWPNTPDILTEALQVGGRPAFMQRLILAATLGGNYGIYGPAFELGEHVPVAPGREEYLDSEKYQIRNWEWDRPDSLAPFIARINRIRHENPALQSDRSLRIHGVDNDQLIVYSKATDDRSNVVLTVVNLDPWHTQSGWTSLFLDDIGVPHDQPYQVHDLITDARFTWQGSYNFVQLNPHVVPAHVFRVRPQAHGEQRYEYFE